MKGISTLMKMRISPYKICKINSFEFKRGSTINQKVVYKKVRTEVPEKTPWPSG